MRISKEIILIGGSAGSYELILDILNVIPNTISQAICVVIHRNANYETHIETSLSIKLNRTITSVVDKCDIIENGVYFAPPGYHLLVEPNYTFSLDVSEPINYSRPSIDVLFETAAEIYKKNCTAFLLSGANHDGARGLRKINKHGGKVFIQDPKEALMDIMPTYALELIPTAKKLTKPEIIQLFNSLK